MAKRPAVDEELTADGQDTAADEDVATRLTRGVVDGFTEASEAFSRELAGTHRVPDLMGRSVAGVIRANARLLDELATMVRALSDNLAAGAPPAVGAGSEVGSELDYERLADLVAERLRRSDVTSRRSSG
jgi:hypothetical protein